MFKFLRKTCLYVLALPLLFSVLGNVSNQAVLYVNNDRFPVKWNDYKVNEYALGLTKLADNKDPDVAEQAAFDLEALKAEGFIDNTHCVMTSKTHLNWLADIIDFHTVTESIGDILIELGDWMWSFAPFVWGAMVIGKLKD